MGNTITADIANLARSHGLEVDAEKTNQVPSGFVRKVISNKTIRKVMQAVVNKFHRLLNLK
jgi:hypothetical protein